MRFLRATLLAIGLMSFAACGGGQKKVETPAGDVCGGGDACGAAGDACGGGDACGDGADACGGGDACGADGADACGGDACGG
jgi:hypothetical protein